MIQGIVTQFRSLSEALNEAVMDGMSHRKNAKKQMVSVSEARGLLEREELAKLTDTEDVSSATSKALF